MFTSNFSYKYTMHQRFVNRSLQKFSFFVFFQAISAENILVSHVKTPSTTTKNHEKVFSGKVVDQLNIHYG